MTAWTPDDVWALYSGCLAAGAVLGAFVALFNSWRV